MHKNQEIIVFCKNVKMLKERNGLTNMEMAKIMGIGSASLTKIESGILPPGVSTSIIFELCKRFNVKPCELFLPL